MEENEETSLLLILLTVCLAFSVYCTLFVCFSLQCLLVCLVWFIVCCCGYVGTCGFILQEMWLVYLRAMLAGSHAFLHATQAMISGSNLWFFLHKSLVFQVSIVVWLRGHDAVNFLCVLFMFLKILSSKRECPFEEGFFYGYLCRCF